MRRSVPFNPSQEEIVMEFTQLIAQRYSCKNFGAGKVDAAALHTILEAGRLAPTAKNNNVIRTGKLIIRF